MADTTKPEETGNPVKDINDHFGFGEAVSFDVPESNDDIPKVPDTKVSFFQAATGDSASDKGDSKPPRRNSDKHRARQREYKQRIEAAKATAPMVAAVLHQYLKTRGIEFPTNDPNFIEVSYWWLDGSKGEEIVKGTIAEAFAFHGLAGATGLSDRLVEFIESHTVIFGLLYIAGLMAYMEVIIQKMIASQAMAEKAKQDSATPVE